MALLSRFFGRTVSEGAAYAFGVATGPVLAPATETIRQEAWNVYQSRIPGVASLAAGVAQGQIPDAEARDWAHKQGFGDDAFNALIDVANVGPDVGMAMQAWRRGKLTDTEFRTVLRRHAIEPQWDAAIEALKVALLEPADLARAIHRGLIPDPGLLQGTLPQAVGHVPAYPVYPIDAVTEADAAGLDKDRLGVLVGLQGNPMGAHEAAQAEFRGILTRDDFLRAIAEGNTRNEWADAIYEQSRSIPSVSDYINAEIRGWITTDERNAGIARHGMTPADGDLLFERTGRPATTHQVHIGFQRGGRNTSIGNDERATFQKAVQESDIRPEWEPILWAQRYTYPPFFALRALAQGKVIDAARMEQILVYEGWEPTLAHDVAVYYTTTAAPAAAENPYVTKADGQLWTALHKAYVKTGASRTDVEPILTHLIPAQSPRDSVFTLWDLERQAQSLPAAPA